MTPLIVRILLTEEFLIIISVLRWMGFALFLKASSFTLGYISFAKGDKKTFFWLEGVFGNISTIVCCITGYLVWGYLGLGVAMLGSYSIYMIVVSVVVSLKYQFKFDKGFLKLFLILFIFCLTAFVLSLVITDYLQYGVVCSFILIVSVWYCFRELNKRMQIKNFVFSKLRSNRK
jgi:F0F1-type ATP synthase membrane subunit c/vacuolar-type H+-ATPase subunit K